MSGRILLTYSSNWELLTHSTLQELQPATEANYSWIYLTQNYYRANYLSRRYKDLATEEAVVIPPIHSWHQFLEKIYDHLPIMAPLLKLQDQLFVLYNILLEHNERLNYFSVRGKPFSAQVVKSIQSIINAVLMRHPVKQGIEEDSFKQELDLIIDEYGKAKQDRFVDETDLLKWIVENLDRNQLQRIFPPVEKLVWEIDAPIYPLQLEVVKKLNELGWEVGILLHCDDHADFFANMNDPYRQFAYIADEVKEVEDPLQLTETFYRLNDSKLSFEKELTLAKYPDRIKEVEEIAKRIKKDLIDGNDRSEQIVVTAPDLAQYLPLLINAFGSHGVPYTVSHPVPLSGLLPLQHFQLLLGLISEDGELSVLKRVLKSPFFEYNDAVKGVPFEEFLNSLRVPEDLKIILQQLEKSLAYDEALHDEQEERDESAIGNKKQLLEVLKKIEKDIGPLTTPFSADEFFRFFNDLMSHHQIVNRILKWRDFLPLKNLADILGAVRTFITRLDLWRNTVNRFEQQSQFPVNAAADIFKLIVDNSNYRFNEPVDYGVQILPLQAVESSVVEQIYILGLTDNSFPRTNNLFFYNVPKPFFKLLPHHQLLDDRRLFLKLLQIPQKGIHLSYPEREGELVNVPSNLMLELQRLTDESITEPESAPVFSKSEILTGISETDENDKPAQIPKIVFDVQQLSHFRRQTNVVKTRNSITQLFGIYEGEISSEKTITEYLSYFSETNEFSVSALELYAKLPIQYFFRKILHVDEPKMFEDWITPLEQGKMVHNVLYRFYGKTSEEQRTLKKLLEIAEDEIERFPFLPSILWNLQREAFLGSEFQTGLFPAFFEYEKTKLQATKLKPMRFEVLFGKFGKRISSKYADKFLQSFEIKHGEDSLKLRGIVDRIEFSPEGGIVVVDYKTGDYASKKDLKEGTSLQLPMYLQAVSYFLKKENPSYYPLAACYYQIKDENKIKKEILFAEGKHSLDAKIIFPTYEFGSKLKEMTFQGFMDRSNAFATKYAKGICHGEFQHHWNTRDCELGNQRECPFEPLCRVNRSKLRYLENYQS